MLWAKLWFKRRSVIITWLLSYLGILMMPILISVVVNYESQKMLESEIHRANDALLEEVKVIIDNQIDNIVRLTTELTWNSRIRAYMYSNYYQNTQNAELRYDLYMTVKDLAFFQNVYPFIKNFYVYWKNGDIVLLPGVYRDSKLAHRTIHEGDNITYDLWLELMHTTHMGKFLKIQSSDPQGSTLAYVQSFKGDMGEAPPGTVVVLLDTAKLLEIISNVEDFSGGEVMILDEMNRVLLSSSKTKTDPYLLSERLIGEKGSFFDNNLGEKSEVFYMKSKHRNLSFITVVPSKLYWEKARYVNNLTYTALFISLVGGILLTVYLLRKNYNPVRRILRDLSDRTKEPIVMEGNEFSFIHTAISNALSEKEQIQYKMKQQTIMLRSNMLSKLLKGQMVHELPLEDSLAAFNIDFKSDRFAIILFYVQDYQTFFDHVRGDYSLDKLKLMQFIMTNIIEELVNQKDRGVMTEVDDCMACLVNLDPADETADIARLRLLADQARKFMLDNFRIDTTISISGIQRTEMGIAEAYKEALNAMEYKFVVGEREIIAYEDIPGTEQSPLPLSYYYPIQVEQQLINQVRAGDYTRAEAIIREIVQKHVSLPKVSVALVKCLMFNLIGTLINTLNEIEDVQDSMTIETWKQIDELIVCESVKEMEQRFGAILFKVCEYTSSKRQQQVQSTRSLILQERSAEIIAFINAKYQDPNLNITMIGDHFEITQTYLSKLFKEQTGSGILDTINKVRMEHAKKLLMGDSASVKTISELVGFHDVNTFIRTFKKYEGVTPGQYQKMV